MLIGAAVASFADVRRKTGDNPERLRIMSYNIWNINQFNEVCASFAADKDGQEAWPASSGCKRPPRLHTPWQGLYHKRIQQLAADVRAADPDIIAFQEVRHDAERDSQAATLAGACMRERCVGAYHWHRHLPPPRAVTCFAMPPFVALLPGYYFAFQTAMSYPERTWHR